MSSLRKQAKQLADYYVVWLMFPAVKLGRRPAKPDQKPVLRRLKEITKMITKLKNKNLQFEYMNKVDVSVYLDWMISSEGVPLG